MRRNENKQNTLALIVGFGLIIIIAIFTIFKPFSDTIEKAPNDYAQSPTTSSDSKQISSEDLLKKIQAKESLAIIDVRSSDEFKNEHILDSQNIPADNFAASIEKLDKNKNYVIVDDRNENIGAAMAADLTQKEFKNVYYLTGGFPSWKSQLNPTISAGNPNSFTDQSKVSYLTSDQLKAMFAAEKNLYIIDVRKSDALAQGHLKGAVNIFLDDLEKRRGEIPSGKKIVLYDTDGLWAFQGAVRLFDMNILNVYALSDGFNTWTQKGFEVIK
ncbi:MAG: rhodanese-like domain-containing protein [Parcubacteria group bacterium]